VYHSRKVIRAPKAQLVDLHKTFPEPDRPSEFFTRGRCLNLVNLLPRYTKSDAPVLYHLPLRTVDRLLENIPPQIIGPAFVMNGRSLFGLDQKVLDNQLCRWKAVSTRDVPVKLAMNLSRLVIARADSINAKLLPEVLEVTGLLTEANLIHGEVANLVLRTVLPKCLSINQLSRENVLSILSGVRRIPISPENAIVFPMLSNFAQWYLDRHKINRLSRAKRELNAKKAAGLLPECSTTVKRIFS
jgi:hypothetical protein